ncbi:hypothetical protein ACFLS9_08840 [Bacteroidota bacterium]
MNRNTFFLIITPILISFLILSCTKQIQEHVSPDPGKTIQGLRDMFT